MRKTFTTIKIKIGNSEENFVTPGIIKYCDDIPQNAIVFGDSQYTIDDFMYDHMAYNEYEALFKVFHVGHTFGELIPISNDEMICLASIMSRPFILHNLNRGIINSYTDTAENPYYMEFDIYETSGGTNEE